MCGLITLKAASSKSLRSSAHGEAVRLIINAAGVCPLTCSQLENLGVKASMCLALERSSQPLHWWAEHAGAGRPSVGLLVPAKVGAGLAARQPAQLPVRRALQAVQVQHGACRRHGAVPAQHIPLQPGGLLWGQCKVQVHASCLRSWPASSPRLQEGVPAAGRLALQGLVKHSCQGGVHGPAHVPSGQGQQGTGPGLQVAAPQTRRWCWLQRVAELEACVAVWRGEHGVKAAVTIGAGCCWALVHVQLWPGGVWGTGPARWSCWSL